jgi:hypothetical protein
VPTGYPLLDAIGCVRARDKGGFRALDPLNGAIGLSRGRVGGKGSVKRARPIAPTAERGDRARVGRGVLDGEEAPGPVHGQAELALDTDLASAEARDASDREGDQSGGRNSGPLESPAGVRSRPGTWARNGEELMMGAGFPVYPSCALDSETVRARGTVPCSCTTLSHRIRGGGPCPPRKGERVEGRFRPMTRPDRHPHT